MTHPKYSGSSEHVELLIVIAQRSSYTLCNLTQSQSSYSLNTQGSHSHWVLHLDGLSPRACDVFRGWGYLPARLKVSGECNFFPLVKSLDCMCAQELLAVAPTCFTMSPPPCQLLGACTQAAATVTADKMVSCAGQLLGVCRGAAVAAVYVQYGACLLSASFRAPLLGRWREYNMPLCLRCVSGYPIPLIAPGWTHTKLSLQLYITSDTGCFSLISSYSPKLVLSPAFSHWCCVLYPPLCCTFTPSTHNHSIPLPPLEFILQFSSKSPLRKCSFSFLCLLFSPSLEQYALSLFHHVGI